MQDDFQEYSLDDLKIFESHAAACRARPALYVGPVDDDTCVSTMLQEAMCFSLQSVLDGRADEILITKHINGTVSVEDNGPNLDPREVRQGLPVVEFLLTRFAACTDAREICRSNFNFGVVSTNALSRSFTFEITFDESLWRQHYRCGVPHDSISVVGRSSSSFRRVSFVPDGKIIQNTNLSYNRFQEWFDECCGMIRGCQINFFDEAEAATHEVASRSR